MSSSRVSSFRIKPKKVENFEWNVIRLFIGCYFILKQKNNLVKYIFMAEL
jgi:hypothetical protein